MHIYKSLASAHKSIPSFHPSILLEIRVHIQGFPKTMLLRLSTLGCGLLALANASPATKRGRSSDTHSLSLSQIRLVNTSALKQ